MVSFASAAAKAAGKCPLDYIRARRLNKSVDVVGVGGERPVEKAVRLRDIGRGPPLIEPRQPLEIKVHRVEVGACSARRASAAAS